MKPEEETALALALSSARTNVELMMKIPSYETVAAHGVPLIFDPLPVTKTNGKAKPAEDPQKCKRGKFVDYADVKLTKLEWLQPNRIPLGKVTLFSGPPGIGKTSVSDDLVAKVTSGLLSDIPGRVL